MRGEPRSAHTHTHTHSHTHTHTHSHTHTHTHTGTRIHTHAHTRTPVAVLAQAILVQAILAQAIWIQAFAFPMPTPGSRSAAAAKASNLFLECAQCFSRQLSKEVAESLRATNFQAQGNKNRPPDQNKTSIQTLLDRPNHVEDEMHAVCHRWKTACISSFT